jgi:hypothetical protein
MWCTQHSLAPFVAPCFCPSCIAFYLAVSVEHLTWGLLVQYLRHDGDLLDKSMPAFIFDGKPFGSVHNILPADNLWVFYD